MVTRRTVLTTGLLGAGLLGAAAWWGPSFQTSGATSPPKVALRTSERDFLGAVATVVLGPALQGDSNRAVEAVAKALATLAPHAQAEFSELLSLMTTRVLRGPLTGVWSDWSEASPQDIAAFLTRWRTSRFSLFQSGYHALHDLILGAWYAQPESWGALGYSGPPTLARA